MNIFIVDDDRDFAESLGLVFEGKGHDVFMAYSGEKAIEKLQNETFDVIFMDIKLPGMNGVESFLEMRKMKPDTKVIMMTGYSLPQLVDEAMENGAWGILKKPFDPQQALSMVDNLNSGDILLVDDDADFLNSLQSILIEKGYRVCAVNSGQEAIKCLERNNIQILILDLKMPIMHGLDVYYEMKKRDLLVPTIIVTAYFEEERQSIASFTNMGVEDILVKPFDPSRLLEILNHIEKKGMNNG